MLWVFYLYDTLLIVSLWNKSFSVSFETPLLLISA